LTFSSMLHQSTRLPVLEKHCGSLQSHPITIFPLSHHSSAYSKPTVPITNHLCLP
jgi:hypothetical protein